MPRAPKRPHVCPKCNRIWEYELKIKKVNYKRIHCYEVIYHEGLTKFGLDEGLCDGCNGK